MKKALIVALSSLFAVILLMACMSAAPSGSYVYEPELFGVSTGIEIGLRFSGSNVAVSGDIAGTGIGFEAGTFSMDGSTLIIVGSNGVELRGTYNRENDTVRLLNFEFVKK